MRILTLEQFCKEPKGTVFSELGGADLDAVLQIKDSYFEHEGKSYFNETTYVAPEPCRLININDVELNKELYSKTFSTDTAQFDYEDSDKFIVYNKKEVVNMIIELQKTFY